MQPTTVPEWRTSTRSGDDGGHCVQVALWPETGGNGGNGANGRACVRGAVLSLTCGDTGSADRA